MIAGATVLCGHEEIPLRPTRTKSPIRSTFQTTGGAWRKCPRSQGSCWEYDPDRLRRGFTKRAAGQSGCGEDVQRTLSRHYRVNFDLCPAIEGRSPQLSWNDGELMMYGRIIAGGNRTPSAILHQKKPGAPLMGGKDRAEVEPGEHHPQRSHHRVNFDPSLSSPLIGGSRNGKTREQEDSRQSFTRPTT